jgi:murein DD-endopeptidase MepM/ murein hydrolase activator NlpD
MPVSGRITSRFGRVDDPFGAGQRYHRGIDIAARWGTKVRSAADGVVRATGFDPVLGFYVLLKHFAAEGFSTLYGHLNEIRVSSGQRVTAGSVVGTVGITGRTTGPHLHFEIRQSGVPKNPERLLNVVR